MGTPTFSLVQKEHLPYINTSAVPCRERNLIRLAQSVLTYLYVTVIVVICPMPVPLPSVAAAVAVIR